MLCTMDWTVRSSTGHSVSGPLDRRHPFHFVAMGKNIGDYVHKAVVRFFWISTIFLLQGSNPSIQISIT